MFDVHNNRELLKIDENIFNGNNYSYIFHRVNSYAVNIMVYLESSSTPALKAIAVFSKSSVYRQNTLLERQFYKHTSSFEVFDSLEEAIIWV